jgi:hypothetical protein
MILSKTSGMAEPPLILCGQPLENTKEHTIKGFHISTTKGSWDSRPHIANKLLAAKNVSNYLLALRKKTITVTPVQNILLYQIYIEPHLTYCSEVTFDCHKSSMKSMTQLQHDVLCTCYGLSIRSVKEIMMTDMAILPILERLLLLAVKYHNYCLNNPSHLANAALLDSIQLSNTARHSWYGSFLKALTSYGIPAPTGTAPIDIADAKTRMTSSVLTTIKLHVAEILRLSIHPDADITWIRKPYTNLEYPLAAMIASLRSSTHFLNVE